MTGPQNAGTQCPVRRWLEPISKLLKQDINGSQLNKTQEIGSVILATNKEASLPLYPSKKTFNQPAPLITPEFSSILSRWLDPISLMRCNHFYTFLGQWVTVIGLITNQLVWPGFNHVKIKTPLYQCHFVMVGCKRTLQVPLHLSSGLSQK